mmetsp:Transcript_29996/g.75501  ORF Transcript_29996/g.75501 Transcript_29996/m.75501 type:complete len:227 (-) Transcript_29996:500-1180(-)
MVPRQRPRALHREVGRLERLLVLGSHHLIHPFRLVVSSNGSVLPPLTRAPLLGVAPRPLGGGLAQDLQLSSHLVHCLPYPLQRNHLAECLWHVLLLEAKVEKRCEQKPGVGQPAPPPLEGPAEGLEGGAGHLGVGVVHDDLQQPLDLRLARELGAPQRGLEQRFLVAAVRGHVRVALQVLEARAGKLRHVPEEPLPVLVLGLVVVVVVLALLVHLVHFRCPLLDAT